MFFVIAQLALTTLLLLLSVIEFTAWAYMGRINGFGYLVCAVVVCLFWAMVKLSYNEFKQERKKNGNEP